MGTMEDWKTLITNYVFGHYGGTIGANLWRIMMNEIAIFLTRD